MANQAKEQPKEQPKAAQEEQPAEKAQPKLGELVRQVFAGSSRHVIAPDAPKDRPIEEIAEALAGEFDRSNLTLETLHNAPLKITTTHGADIYKVVELMQKKAGGN